MDTLNLPTPRRGRPTNAQVAEREAQRPVALPPVLRCTYCSQPIPSARSEAHRGKLNGLPFHDVDCEHAYDDYTRQLAQGRSRAATNRARVKAQHADFTSTDVLFKRDADRQDALFLNSQRAQLSANERMQLNPMPSPHMAFIVLRPVAGVGQHIGALNNG